MAGSSVVSFASSLTSISSVSSAGVKKAFEESLEQALKAAQDTEEANAERRRLADEYLDVALYIYDQLCGRLHAELARAVEQLKPAGAAARAPATLDGGGGSGGGGGGSADDSDEIRMSHVVSTLADGVPLPQNPYENNEKDAQQALADVAVLAQATLRDALVYARRAAHAGAKYAEASDALDNIASNREAIFGLSALSLPPPPPHVELKLPARHALFATPTPAASSANQYAGSH